jgi:uncharacterized metal-binding protein YceD (DUF177 family)
VGTVLKAYTISFKGLKLGKHSFDFEVNNDFFSEFPEGEIREGALNAKVKMNKQENLLEFDIVIKGEVKVTCDRCLEQFFLPVQYKGFLLAKITSEEMEDEADIMYLTEDDHEINLARYLYESIHLSLPIKRYHGLNGTSIDDCDQEMLKYIHFEEEQEVEVDPRWEALKKLLDNNN